MQNLTDKDISRELEKIFEECSSDGWDGERAKPVSKEVLRHAAAFLESFPSGIELPDIGAEPDGSVSLEWYRSAERVISVSVNPGGEIFYAAIVDGRKIHGRDSGSFGVSDDLLTLISRVTGKAT